MRLKLNHAINCLYFYSKLNSVLYGFSVYLKIWVSNVKTVSISRRVKLLIHNRLFKLIFL